MITILDGILTIPEAERFIGFAGDNLNRKIEFLLSGAKEADRIYRLYLTFDDGTPERPPTINYFTLPFEVTDKGVVLTWEVKLEHIFKSGIVKAQIKAFSDTGVVYHTTADTFIVGDSAEFPDRITGPNSEFLQYEQRLNDIATLASQLCAKMPYIGESGNWYIYDIEKGEYTDSGNPSVGQNESSQIADGAVVTDKIADSAVTDSKLADGAVTDEKLARSYWEVLSQSGIFSYSVLDKLFESVTNQVSKSIFKLRFDSNFPAYNLVGGDSYIGAFDVHGNVKTLFLVNMNGGNIFTYEKGSEEIVAKSTYVYTDNSIERTLILSHKADYRFSAERLHTLTVMLPEFIEDDFESSVVFRSGETPTILTCPSSVKWSGDDVAGVTDTGNGSDVTYNCLVPQSNKTYNVIFWYDGFNVNAIARGASNG